MYVFAPVVESVDTRDLKSLSSDRVWVRVPPGARACQGFDRYLEIKTSCSCRLLNFKKNHLKTNAA